ncbi:uncharacterized protein LOC123550226 [Mercenaria mercenaria]|uniref:uncharacterized protein LOC123550226 n=1 Tax=Mercenaria mercenaria TaxID=6596 RepID=UPI00234E403F|nr:uncharacterized protein LOC123550226 [Mercenaria mercenaria]
MESAGRWFHLSLVMMCPSVCVGIYLISDYYMDDGWPSAFGQVCGKSIEDDCLYVNSHLNSLGILNYDDDINCTVQLNAGNRHGARYKLSFKRFDLEYSENCSYDSLTVYDTKVANICFTAPIDRFCGNTAPNLTGYPTQQYMTLKFQTDGSTGKKGYRIMATRTLPYPCHDDYFHCKAENRCIDGRLHCDGTKQCDDGTDEDGCSFWEKLLGGFLALGVSGIVGVSFLVVVLCTGICVTVCVCTCCKKHCRCVSKLCDKCCKPCKSGDNKVKPETGMVEGNKRKEKGVADKGEEVEIADEVAVKSPHNTGAVSSKSPIPDPPTAEENPPAKLTIVAKTPLPSDGHALSSASATGVVSDSHVTETGMTSTLNVADSTVTKVD